MPPLLRSPLRSPLRGSIYSPITGPWVSGPPFSRFTQVVDFAGATTVGVTQPYGNNTLDGRAFRDSGNFQACYIPNKAGLYILQASSGVRRTDKGTPAHPTAALLGLWGADLTQAATWITSTCTVAKNQVGADGTANAATLVTANQANAVIKQTVTATIADCVLSSVVKRVTGSGTLDFSLDNEATWQSVTPTASYKDLWVSQLQVTNPTLAFRLGTSGDSFAFDFSMITPPLNAQLVNYGYKARTVGTAFGNMSRSTVWALNTDGSPIYTTISSGPYAFYWQGSADQVSSALPGLFISDGSFFLKLAANNAVSYGGAVSANNSWVPGVGNINKVAGWTNGTTGKLCVNGQTPVACPTAPFTPIGTHFVVSSNGAGASANNGFTEKVAFSPNLTFSDADLISMTT